MICSSEANNNKPTSPSTPASLHLDLVLEESIAATERNHSSPTQIHLVQLVQNGCCHHIRHEAQNADQQDDQAGGFRALLVGREQAQCVKKNQ